MVTQSGMHFYLNWAKERIDEMDAVLASLEGKAKEVQAESAAKANRLFADMRHRRDEFQETVKKQAEAGEAAFASTKAQLDSIWNGFEAEVKNYIDTFGKQIEQQQRLLQDVAQAQLRAWHGTAEKIQSAATEFKTDRRTDIDAALNLMKAGASEAETSFQALKRAGTESWTAWSAALAESRKAFDRANQSVWDAFKRAASPEK